jgi:flagellar protein FlaJ
MMSFYTKQAFRLFGHYSENILDIFSDLKIDLKKAGMKISAQEYACVALFTTFLIFLVALPIFSLILGLLTGGFLFSFITSFTLSLCVAFLAFIFFLNYPKFVKNEKAKEIERALPFASLYLSTIAGSELPLHTSFKLFTRFGGYGRMGEEINMINQDVELFGLDINTALERAVDRTPSKNLSELLWGILSVARAGGKVQEYLKQKSASLMQEHRRKLSEFAHSLTVYIEIYLTAIILGAIFFTVLTAIVSGITGAGGRIILLQAFLIFVFIPLISTTFIYLIKKASPPSE